MNSSDEHDARCESELVLEAGMYTACDCKARQAHAHHEALSPLAPDCSYGGEASPPRQPSDHDRTVADGHTLTNTLRYACWLRSHDAEVAAAVRAEAVADERRRNLEVNAASEKLMRYAAAVYRHLQMDTPEDQETHAKVIAMLDRGADAFASRAAGSVPVATPTGIVRPDGVAYTTDEVAEIFVEQQHSLTVGTPPAEPAASRPVPVPCSGFQWIGQSFAHCDRCGLPYWEHTHSEQGDRSSGPFSGKFVLVPITDEKRQAARAKCVGPVSVPKESSE